MIGPYTVSLALIARNEDSSKKQLYRIYKSSAKNRSYSFDINYEDFINIVQQNCFYCGERPKQICKSRTKRFMYNGIDRVNNNKGYFINNVVPCCKKCNRAKWQRKKKDFMLWVKRCYDNIISNKL